MITAWNSNMLAVGRKNNKISRKQGNRLPFHVKPWVSAAAGELQHSLLSAEGVDGWMCT